ncbi:MAG: TlpA disulfide reductase family protein [bacterium]|nr:TlpA disulfide reductase family protein [bacterium]
MRRFPVIIAVALVALMLAAPVFAADESAAVEAGPLKVGDVLPDGLLAATLDGAPTDLKKNISDKPFTFFQFMTTACSACQGEMGAFIGLQLDMPGKFDVVAISMDMMGADAVNAYESKFKYGVKYLLDPDFKLPPRFNFPYTPSFFIVNQEGKIVYMKGGFMSSRWAKDRDAVVEVIQ